MSHLRSQVIRLAYENPSLRPHLLPIVTEGMKSAANQVSGVTFEIKLRAAMRDYRTDPGSPVQTHDVLIKPLAWARFTYASAKEASKSLSDIVKDITTQWEKGIDKGHLGAVDLYKLRSPYTGGKELTKAIPDYYRTAEILIERVLASGDHKIISEWSWKRGEDWKKVK